MAGCLMTTMAACGNNNLNIKNETNKDENGMLYTDNKEKALALIGSFA